MNKLSKKYVLTTLILICSLIINGCVSQNPKELGTKVTDAIKNINNGTFVSTTKIDLVSNNDTTSVDLSTKLTSTKEPYSIAGETSSKVINANGEENSNIAHFYFKNNELYYNENSNPGWTRYKGNLPINPEDTNSIITAITKLAEIIQNYSSGFTLQKDGDNTVISFSGDGDEFKELFIAILNMNNSYGNTSSATADNTEFKNVAVKYVVKSSDYTPVSAEFNMEVIDKNIKSSSMKLNQTINFSNINSTNEITIPTEVTNNVTQTIGN